MQNPGSYDECIPIGDFSFDPHKIICCSLESGNILSHGSGGKGYGLATTAITSGCFIWKVNNLHSFFYPDCSTELRWQNRFKNLTRTWPLSSVPHHQREPRQWGHMYWCFTLASQRSQPPYHHWHVALPCIQRQPVSRRGTGPLTSFLYPGWRHHLHLGHGGAHHIIR